MCSDASDHGQAVQVVARFFVVHRIGQVQEVTPFNFGLIVAYVVPGFVILQGFSYHSATVAAWLANAGGNTTTIGGLLHATLASVACGMFANLSRWAVIDTIHHRTGVRFPRWDFSRLQEQLGAYQLLNELHYKHYQYAANMLMAVVFTYVAFRSSPGGWRTHWGAMDIGVLIVCVVLFFGSRDALTKYYQRVGELLRPTERG